ncbi:hypothetical protein GF362_01385 [Candidatus Dojkabacteria bacterium]|nr:hypothetical protein [Candidatus Dojkabacteria bacterium]
MGSYIEINDTLRITKKQGFPEELDINQYKNSALDAEGFQDRLFEFKGKPNIRIYHAPPVRVFLVEDIDGKWLYWGIVHILETTLDMEKKITSGKYKIVKIFTLEEMKKAHELIDGNPDTNYFN